MSFVRRLIDITFVLGKGAFGEDGSDTVRLSGLRVSAKILKAGGHAMGNTQLSIFGMTESSMNKLSTLGRIPNLFTKNSVTVTAGDEGGAMTVVFAGTITEAWVNYQAMPQVVFNVIAHSGFFESIKPAQVSSYPGAPKVQDIMKTLAKNMDLEFENNGVDAVLNAPYFWGSNRNQAQACADATGINWLIDNGKLAIWPANGQRGPAVPIVSAETGMVGYPSYTSTGIELKSLFNPAFKFGGAIEVKSSLGIPANGKWIVNGLDYDLESMVPKGSWFAMLSAVRQVYFARPPLLHKKRPRISPGMLDLKGCSIATPLLTRPCL